MHPAFSVIFFTVVSGCGYGLLFLLGLQLAIAPRAMTGNQVLIDVAVGAAFAAAGLISSMLHLGQPWRAWRAFSQWRSSWLSREGVAAVASFVPMAALLIAAAGGAAAAVRSAWGLMLAACAVVTVFCTAKIYTTLKTIPAWHNPYVLPGYLLLGLLGGAAWSWLLHGGAAAGARALPALVAALALASAALKMYYWRFVDAQAPAATPETATGLGRFGSVHSVEAPHTEENYLTREMGFALARKHARRLRPLSLLLIGAIPAMLATLGWLTGTATLAQLCAFATAMSVTCGLFVERWLFFAQAKHVVMLYYGSRAHAQRA